MLKTIKRWVVIILVTSVIFMTLLAILSIWDVLGDDIASKALSTLGVVLVACAISLVIAKIIDDKDGNHQNQIRQ